MVLSAGDSTESGTNEEFSAYTQIRDSANIPVFEVTGNHDASSRKTYKSDITNPDCIAYKFNDLVGKDFCYYLKGDKYYGWKLTLSKDGKPTGELTERSSGVTIPDGDVYIFVGILGDINNNLFFAEEMQWLQGVLEENRNNRCFVTEHCRADRLQWDSSQNKFVADNYADYVSGNYGGKYIKALWGKADNTSDGKYARCFEELMSHYTNCIWLHGHSHMSAKTAVAHGTTPYLYDTYFGDAYNANSFNASQNNKTHSYSVHIPSCAEPREENGVNPAGSEGCLMTVKENEVIFTYIDFTTGGVITEFTLPTVRNIIPENTFTDVTGLIK